MLALFICVCIMPFFDFRRIKYATLLSFILRLTLSLIVGFIVFFYASLWVKIAITAFSLLILSILANAMSDEPGIIGVFCFFMLFFNVAFGLFGNSIVTFTIGDGAFVRYDHILNISMVISLFAALSFFMINNIDSVRWFSSSRLKIPQIMKRSSIVFLAIIGIMFVALAFASWIARAIGMLINGLIGLIQSLFDLIANVLQDPYIPYQYPLPPDNSVTVPPNMYEPRAEVEGASSVIGNILIGLIVIALVGAIIFGIIKLSVRILKILLQHSKAREEIGVSESAVFTEIVEKLTPIIKKKMIQNREKQPRYSSLLTERERILFIYREYVRRAKNNGLTQDKCSDTPNEILEEIAEKANGQNFPHTGELGTIYNTARYSNGDISNASSADELKRRLGL